MEKLTRRALLTSLVAAPLLASAVKIRPKGKRARERIIVVATPGINGNGRDYSSVLVDMRKQAEGRLVVSSQSEKPVPLDEAWGIVETAWIRKRDGALGIKVKWFGDPPAGVFITPTGVGTLEGSTVKLGYYLEQFDLSWDSSFEHATPI